jgi:uncharacterized membrane protein
MNPFLTRVSAFLAGLGMLVSAYMTIYKLTDNQTMCLGNGGCSVVNSSVYSEVYGIPVALVGLLGYSAILAVLILSSRSTLMGSNASLLVFGLCLTGFLFTLYLIYVEIALIRALCPFCLASQAIMTFLFAISVILLIREPTT